MTILERILLALSRTPESRDFPEADFDTPIERALDLVNRVFPDFHSIVSGKRVLDFGCGTGLQSIALVKNHGCSVTGLDTNPKTLARAIENASAHGVSSSSLSFVDKITPEMRNRFDVVLSQNSFEHFSDPAGALLEMAGLLTDTGIILLTFGPPWLAPYGSHMHFFCKVPWLNVLFPEKTVMSVRGRFRNDGATRYENVESGLNKMTVAGFESIVSSCGLRITHKNYECVKGATWLARVPFLREFFINHITAILARTPGGG